MDEDPAFVAYQAFASVYDDFNHLNDYEMWLGQTLLPELEKHGLRKGSALDVGCGTGRAFAPLLQRGWKVHGCDLSPAMLEAAAQKAGDEVVLAAADMRDLPQLGEFDLVLSLNDSVNYLTGDDDLRRALGGMASNLKADGLLIFDTNSRSTYAGTYSETGEVEFEGRRWTWNGLGQVEAERPIFEARIEGDGISPVGNRERFRPEKEVLQAMEAADLRCLAALGMREENEEVILTEPPDEGRDYKVVYIGKRQTS